MKILKAHLLAICVSLLVAGAAGAGSYFAVLHIAGQARDTAVQAKGVLTDARAAIQGVTAVTKDVKDTVDDLYPDVKATIETVAVTAKDSDDLVHDLRASLVGGVDTTGKTRDGLLTAATTLLSSANDLVGTMKTDLNRLTDSSDAALKPLATALSNVATLTATLDTQVKTGGAEVKVTMDSLKKALDDLDKVIADPSIAELLKGAAKTSVNLGQSAESLEIATRPWREKANQLKLIITKALELLKFTVPL